MAWLGLKLGQERPSTLLHAHMHKHNSVKTFTVGGFACMSAISRLPNRQSQPEKSRLQLAVSVCFTSAPHFGEDLAIEG